MSYEKRFREVYAKRLWQTAGVLSGDGSQVKNTASVADWLDSLPEQGMKTILDMGCGDLEWVSRRKVITEGRLDYFGVDVVPELIGHHLRVFPWFKGEARDMEAMVKISADVVILKDVLFHYCNGAAGQILQFVNEGNWKRLLVTSHPGARNEIRRGLQGGRMMPYDVEATGIIAGAPSLRLARPDGEYLVYHRD